MVSDDSIIKAAILRCDPYSNISAWSKTLRELEDKYEAAIEIHNSKVPGGWYSDELDRYVGTFIIQGMIEQVNGKYGFTKEGIAELDDILGQGLAEKPEFVRSLIKDLLKPETLLNEFYYFNFKSK